MSLKPCANEFCTGHMRPDDDGIERCDVCEKTEQQAKEAMENIKRENLLKTHAQEILIDGQKLGVSETCRKWNIDNPKYHRLTDGAVVSLDLTPPDSPEDKVPSRETIKPEPSFTCPVCEEPFTSKGSLGQHKRHNPGPHGKFTKPEPPAEPPVVTPDKTPVVPPVVTPDKTPPGPTQQQLDKTIAELLSAKSEIALLNTELFELKKKPILPPFSRWWFPSVQREWLISYREVFEKPLGLKGPDNG
jgi:hypothetical protein